MNKIDWLDNCFALADTHVEEYLRLKDFPSIEIRKPLLCRAKAAYEYLGISKSEFYKLKNDGKIPFVDGFDEDRYKYDDLEALVAQNTTKIKDRKKPEERVKRYIYLTETNHELCTAIADKLGMKIYELEGMIFEEGLKSHEFKLYKKLAKLE